MNYRTGEIVGISDKAFSINALRDEMLELQKSTAKTDDDLLTTEDTTPTLPSQVQHFLVFFATTWSEQVKQEFLVARYGVNSVDSDFLIPLSRSIAVDLALYGFIEDTFSGDGAGENRKTNKFNADITARQVFTELGGEEIWPEEVLEGLPLDFPIAFRHPSPHHDSLIFIGGEMPHWVKKFRNAMENKSRNLTYKGKSVNLEKCYVAWKSVGGCSLEGLASGTQLNKSRLTMQHFVLNPYNKMRVPLAVQITSQSMIETCKEFCTPPNKGVIEEYEPMIELLDNVDRLIDIMNGKAFNRGKKKNVWTIDSPNDPLIVELFNILRTFEEWKEEAGGFTDKFITQYTYEDLVWMVFGVAGVAAMNLKIDGSLKMHQGRSGTDVCENFFSRVRAKNPNPNYQHCKENTGSALASGNMNAILTRAGNNSSGAQVTHGELLAKPIKKKK